MEQTGVKLKRDWYGNPEGRELWDLDADTMTKLVQAGKAEYITRSMPSSVGRSQPVIEEPTGEPSPSRKK